MDLPAQRRKKFIVCKQCRENSNKPKTYVHHSDNCIPNAAVIYTFFFYQTSGGLCPLEID